MILKLFGFDVLPVELTQGFERAIERFVFVYEGKADPDRPIEQLEESFDHLKQLIESNAHAEKLKKLGLLANGLAKAFAERPRLRKFVVNRALRGWRELVDDTLDPSHPLVAYLTAIHSTCPGSSLLAFASWPGIGMEFQGKTIQANTYLAEATNRTGEARYNSTKKLARVVLDELYPRYLEALCVLESARIGTSVTPTGKQARSFGSMVQALKASLPATAQCIVDFEAHKIRNSFDHGRARWIREGDSVELHDERWSKTMPTTELLDRLRAMHAAYTEGLIALLLHGSDFAVRIAEKHLTWDAIVQKRPDFENALSAAIEPAAGRLKPWFQNVPPKEKPQLASGQQSQL